jgi:hypothetical protein
MTNGNVLGFLAAPDRESSLRAISLALLKVRALDGMTCEKLGKTLECSADTIRNASNEETLLGFDSVMRLCYFWPDESAPIRALQQPPTEAPTVADRLERIERELDAIRKEAA